MFCDKFLQHLKNLRQRFSNNEKDDISFESFMKYPIFFTRMLLLDLKPSEASPTLKEMIKWKARKFFYLFSLISCFIGFLQVVIYSVIYSDDFDVIVRSITDISTLHIQGIECIFEKRWYMENCLWFEGAFWKQINLQ